MSAIERDHSQRILELENKLSITTRDYDEKIVRMKLDFQDIESNYQQKITELNVSIEMLHKDLEYQRMKLESYVEYSTNRNSELLDGLEENLSDERYESTFQ